MKVLITGATGLVGTALVNVLLAKGVQVNFLTTRSSKLKGLPGCIGFLWNVSAGEIDAKCIEGVDAIIHLAGANVGKRWTSSYKKQILNSRVDSGVLLKSLLDNNPNQVKQFISASGISIYKSSLTENYLESSTEFGDSFLADVTKQWEAVADDIPVASVAKVRTGVVLVKGEGALVKMMDPIKKGVGAALGSGKQLMSWVHLDDLVAMYVYVLDNKLSGIYNAVAPEVVSNEKLTKALATKLGKKIFLPNVPTFMLKLILGEMYLLLCESQKVSSEKIKQEGFEFKYGTLNKALEEIFN